MLYVSVAVQNKRYGMHKIPNDINLFLILIDHLNSLKTMIPLSVIDVVIGSSCRRKGSRGR